MPGENGLAPFPGAWGLSYSSLVNPGEATPIPHVCPPTLKGDV